MSDTIYQVVKARIINNRGSKDIDVGYFTKRERDLAVVRRLIRIKHRASSVGLRFTQYENKN